jgi:methionine-rich copper-binding protein CopC
MKRVGAAVALGLLTVLLTATPASAHNYLVSSTPQAGETLTALPEHFSVTTNEPLLDLGGDGSGFGIEIIDENGLYYGDGCVTVEGASISTVPAIGEAGTYRFVYQVVSADGHTVSDEFTFDWAPGAEFAASAGSATPGDCNGLYSRGEVTDETADAASVDLSTVLWIGGALLAVGIAVIVTFIVLRPRTGA